MVSNKLSKKVVKKPPICKPPPPRPVPPILPPPLPPRTCSIDPDDFTLPVDEAEDLTVEAGCAALPHAEALPFTHETTGGELESTQNPTNCDSAGDLHYSAPGDPGDYLIRAHFTWSDGGKRTAYAVAHVEEQENGDD